MTDKQEIAVQNYCLKGIRNRDVGYSWSQAMRDAGYKEGYIDKNAHLLRDKPEIKEAIEEEKARFRDRLSLDAQDVINELTLIGFSNIEDYIEIDERGEVKIRGFEGIDRAKLAAIESIKVNITKNKDETREYATTQFKMHSKLSALDALCKHLGLFKADNTQKTEAPELSADERAASEEAARLYKLRLA